MILDDINGRPHCEQILLDKGNWALNLSDLMKHDMEAGGQELKRIQNVLGSYEHQFVYTFMMQEYYEHFKILIDFAMSQVQN
jgi:hypothetical protein